MARQPEDLSLSTGLIRKGEARGIDPALAAAPRREDAPASATPEPPLSVPAAEDTDPPLRAAPPEDVAKRFTSFRLPVALDEELRAMMFETRRSKQDLLTEFVTEGVRGWRRDRTRRGS